MLYSLRVNLSVSLVAMVNSTYAHVETSRQEECGVGGNQSRQIETKRMKVRECVCLCGSRVVDALFVKFFTNGRYSGSNPLL